MKRGLSTVSSSDLPLTNAAQVWNDRYLRGRTPWDIGSPSGVVCRLAEAHLTKRCRVLVPGCGLGQNVDLLARMGHDALGVDFAPAAIDAAVRRSRVPGARFEVGDVLRLPERAFDAVVEHTCLCALERSSWPTYAASLAAALRPSGLLLGAFLCFENSVLASPPFGTSPEQLLSLFVGAFDVEHMAMAPEPFPPLGVPVPPTVFRVPQLEVVLRRRSVFGVDTDERP